MNGRLSATGRSGHFSKSCYPPLMKYHAILFDLDGTLADTLADIAAAGNHMLSELGRPARPVADYRYLAGQGLEYLVNQALEGASTEQIAHGLEVFRAYYASHNHELTTPYDGVPEMLDNLTEKGVIRAVLSNKPHEFTVEVVQRLFAQWTFEHIAGARPDVPLKPDPAAAFAIMDALRLPAEQWAYLGDTKVDMFTATAAGMFAIGCTWGFRDERELRDAGADAIVNHPGEVMALLQTRVETE